MSRVDQCKALTTVKAPKTSGASSSEELLEVQKTYLEGYKKLSLSDADLKQARDNRIAYYERSVEISKEAIVLAEEIKGKTPTVEQMQRMMTQTSRNLEVWSQLTPLLSETNALCPNVAAQK